MRAAEASAVATWDGHAERYGAQERFERAAIAALLAAADVRPQERLVDLATGTGAVLRALAAGDARPVQATGVDRSAGMLARIGPLPDGWQTVRADAASVPLADGSADVVTCAYLLHLLDADERAAVLAEARRLLAPAPGSRLVLATVWADPRPAGGRVLHWILRAMARARPRAWGGLMPLDPMPELAAAGLVATRRVVVPRGGYPSLVIRAAVRSRAADA